MNTTRHVSAGHLVFGLIFLGITAMWVVGGTTDAEVPALAVWGPVVLIAAGLVGLAATMFNSRQARIDDTARLETHTDAHAEEHHVEEDLDATDQPEDDDTRVLDHEEKS